MQYYILSTMQYNTRTINQRTSPQHIPQADRKAFPVPRNKKRRKEKRPKNRKKKQSLGRQPHNEYPIKKQWNLEPLPCITLIQPAIHFSPASTFGPLLESLVTKLVAYRPTK